MRGIRRRGFAIFRCRRGKFSARWEFLFSLFWVENDQSFFVHAFGLRQKLTSAGYLTFQNEMDFNRIFSLERRNLPFRVEFDLWFISSPKEGKTFAEPHKILRYSRHTSSSKKHFMELQTNDLRPRNTPCTPVEKVWDCFCFKYRYTVAELIFFPQGENPPQKMALYVLGYFLWGKPLVMYVVSPGTKSIAVHLLEGLLLVTNHK